MRRKFTPSLLERDALERRQIFTRSFLSFSRSARKVIVNEIVEASERVLSTMCHRDAFAKHAPHQHGRDPIAVTLIAIAVRFTNRPVFELDRRSDAICGNHPREAWR